MPGKEGAIPLTEEPAVSDGGSAAAQGPPAARRNPARTGEYLRRYGVLIFLVLLAVVFCVIEPARFATTSNVVSIIQSNSTTVLLALIVTFQVRAGTIDFSLSASMILGASIVAVLTTQDHMGVVPAALIAVAATTAVGLFNSTIVVRAGLDGFIATLGMSTVLTGVAYAITKDSVVTNLPTPLLNLGRASIGEVPSAAIVGWCLAIVAWLVFEFTPLGRLLAFVGGNQISARLAGVRVTRIRIGVFVVGAGLAGLTGVFLASTLGNVDPTTSGSYLLTPFSTAFLGAAAIQVGRFNVAGTIVAVYLIAIAETGIELLGAAVWVSDVFSGGALIMAIGFARLTAVRQERLLIRSAQLRERSGEAGVQPTALSAQQGGS